MDLTKNMLLYSYLVIIVFLITQNFYKYQSSVVKLDEINVEMEIKINHALKDLKNIKDINTSNWEIDQEPKYYWEYFWPSINKMKDKKLDSLQFILDTLHHKLRRLTHHSYGCSPERFTLEYDIIENKYYFCKIHSRNMEPMAYNLNINSERLMTRNIYNYTIPYNGSDQIEVVLKKIAPNFQNHTLDTLKFQRIINMSEIIP